MESNASVLTNKNLFFHELNYFLTFNNKCENPKISVLTKKINENYLKVKQLNKRRKKLITVKTRQSL